MMFIGQLAFCASGNKRLSIGCSMLATLPDTIILYTDEHFDTTGILSVFPGTDIHFAAKSKHNAGICPL